MNKLYNTSAVGKGFCPLVNSTSPPPVLFCRFSIICFSASKTNVSPVISANNRLISSKLRPRVSGSKKYTKIQTTIQTAANIIKNPVHPINSAVERKVLAISVPVIRLKNVARLIAFARILVAKISDGTSQAIGWKRTKKNKKSGEKVRWYCSKQWRQSGKRERCFVQHVCVVAEARVGRKVCIWCRTRILIPDLTTFLDFHSITSK